MSANPTRGELDAAAVGLGAKAGGFATIQAHWFGASFLPLLRPGELIAFLYVLTCCQGRRKPWNIPAGEVASRCGINRQTAIKALRVVRDLGIFACHQSRDHDGSPRWYYALREPASWDLSALNAFIESRREKRVETVTRLSSHAEKRRQDDGTLGPPPSPAEQDRAESSSTVQGRVQSNRSASSSSTGPIGIEEYVSENISEVAPLRGAGEARKDEPKDDGKLRYADIVVAPHLVELASKYTKSQRRDFDRDHRLVPVKQRIAAWHLAHDTQEVEP